MWIDDWESEIIIYRKEKEKGTLDFIAEHFIQSKACMCYLISN